jgi:hypothetical protein
VKDLALLFFLSKKCNRSYVPHNCTLHLKLNNVDDEDEFLHSRQVQKLLSKGPNFGLMSGSRSLVHSVSKNWPIFVYRIVSTLDRGNRADIISKAKEISSSHGLLPWKPCKPPYPPEFYEAEVKRMLRADREQYHSCPELPSELERLKRSVFSSAKVISDELCKQKHIVTWGNLSKAERAALKKLTTMDICFGSADKNLGPVLSSSDLVLRQAQLQLQDDAHTYREIVGKTKLQIIEEGIKQLEGLQITFPKFAYLLERFVYFAKWCADKPRLCKVFVLWKLHKKPKDNGLESRLIAPNCGYFTADASTFLHHQLAPFVFAHDFVLEDSLSLCRYIEDINCDQESFWETTIATADVVALYPSIPVKDGLIALRWFMDKYTSFPSELKLFIDFLARFVLDNNFVECEGVGSGIFQQVIGVPMGTSFSVVFSIIFMLWLEEPIISKYKPWILLFKRAIDDQIFIWRGPSRKFEELKHDFNNAHPAIKFDWGKLSKSAIFLDLNLKLLCQRDNFSLFIQSSVFCKPGNAFAYLSPDSFHPRHSFKGWIRGLLIRNITRNNTIALWRAENLNLYRRLRARSFKHSFLVRIFETIRWQDRTFFLKPKEGAKVRADYKVVLSSEYVPGFTAISKLEALDFHSFRNTPFTTSIFPSSGSWVAKGAPKLGHVLRKI